MEFRYYLDPATGLPHIYEHGIPEAEPLQAYRRRLRKRGR